MKRISLYTKGLFLSLALVGCGGSSGGGGSAAPSEIGTLAYVETECRGSRSEGFVESQALRIRQGDREPITVFETPQVGPLPGKAALCIWVDGGFGDFSISREALQAVTVSPDGSSVVFEVSDDFSSNPHLPLNLPPEQKGIFWVRADGTGLRRLGPASRERFFYVEGGGVSTSNSLSFSPNGRTIAFVDKGPDFDGQEADQMVTIDVASGARTQLTHLPPAVPPPGTPGSAPTIFNRTFLNDQTVSFKSCANPAGANPSGTYLLMTVKTDGSGFDVPFPIPVAVPGSKIELRFVISGDRPEATGVRLPGEPINHLPYSGGAIIEVFVIDQEENILQLTNFHRVDTSVIGFDPDEEHVYFIASADPLGTNPSENCQLFSIHRSGADLRQITDFGESLHSGAGCIFTGSPKVNGCAVGTVVQDLETRTLILFSNCDPLGTNAYAGGQIFAVEPDGSGLRQLTDERGLRPDPDGFSGQVPGPFSYGPYLL